MNEQELRLLAAEMGIGVDELRSLIARGQLQTSDLKARLARLEQFMGRSLASSHKRPVVNRTLESADAYNKKVADWNLYTKQRAAEKEEDRKSKEKEATWKMLSNIRKGREAWSPYLAALYSGAVASPLAGAVEATGPAIAGALGTLGANWALFLSLYPIAAAILNAINTGLGIGALASDNGVQKTLNAASQGRYADAVLSGMGDLWNGYVVANGLNNFGNLVAQIGRQFPADFSWLSGESVIFDPRNPFGLFYMGNPYGVPKYLPSATVPGGAGRSTTVYRPPVRTTGVNSPYGQTYWQGTTLGAPIKVLVGPQSAGQPGTPVPQGAPFTFTAASTPPPVPGIPVVPPMTPPVIPPPIVSPPVMIPPLVTAPINYSAEVQDPGFIRWWNLNYTDENIGKVLWYNGMPILMLKDPRVWANDATNNRVSPNYQRDYGDYGNYQYYNTHNGYVVPEDDSNWDTNEKKRSTVERKARASGVVKSRSK